MERLSTAVAHVVARMWMQRRLIRTVFTVTLLLPLLVLDGNVHDLYADFKHSLDPARMPPPWAKNRLSVWRLPFAVTLSGLQYMQTHRSPGTILVLYEIFTLGTILVHRMIGSNPLPLVLFCSCTGCFYSLIGAYGSAPVTELDAVVRFTPSLWSKYARARVCAS